MSRLDLVIDTISKKNPRHGKKIKENLMNMDAIFYDKAELFLKDYETFVKKEGKELEFGVDSYLKMINDMMYEQVQFFDTGEYSCKSFEEAYEKVYNNPAIMEYYMHGLLMSQFLWRHHYSILKYFTSTLTNYKGKVGSYLEVGGGHGLYLSEAIKIFGEDKYYSLVDISESSISLAKNFLHNSNIEYLLQDITKYKVEKPFDLITIGEVIEHLEDPLDLLKKIGHVLSPNGRIFLTAPANAPAIDHIYLFKNIDEIISLIEEAGYIVEDYITTCSEKISRKEAEAKKIPIMFAGFIKKNNNMDNTKVLDEVITIFKDVIDEDDMNLTIDSTPEDVEGWDSLTNIRIIVAIERKFNIKFTASEVDRFNSIKEVVNTVTSKV